MSINNFEKYNLKDKLALVRIDVNSAVSKGKPKDSPRFKVASETIKNLVKKKARVVLIAHQGRKGDSDFISLKGHSNILEKHSGVKIKYVDYLFEERAKKEIANLMSGECILLKNVRSYDDETNPEDKENRFYEFCRYFDFFVNDAFSVSHRSQASIIIPPKLLPSFAGNSLYAEYSMLNKFRNKIKSRKSGMGIFLIGGSKIEDYMPLFENLKNKNNYALVSGILANLFLNVKGINLGYEIKWMEEKGFTKINSKITEIYNRYKEQIILPMDVAIDDNGRKELTVSKLPINKKLLDVGEDTIFLFKEYVKRADFIFMKGPLGFSEVKRFSKGTVNVLNEISKRAKSKNVLSILGGGHLTTTMSEYKIKNNFSYTSNSGGALIAFLSGKELPGLSALDKCKIKLR